MKSPNRVAHRIVGLVLSCFVLANAVVAEEQDNLGGYVLQPGDVVQIEVFGEPGLTGAFTVTEDGVVTFPLVGDINAQGQTSNELKEILEQGLSGRFLKEPDISVQVVAYRKYFVTGAVKNPGAYPFSPGITAREVISLAGGTKGRTGRSVEIVHENRETTVTKVLNTPIEPGDVVHVSEISGCLSCEEVAFYENTKIEPFNEPQGIVVMGGVIFPQVDLDISHDDNIFRTAADAKSSIISVLSPSISWQGGRLWSYQLDYAGGYGRFHDSSADNFEDHALSAQTVAGVTENSDVHFQGKLELGHDRRGTELTEASPELREVPDRWRHTSVRGEYEYGIVDNSPGFSLAGEILSRTYLNNRETTEPRDLDERNLAVQVQYPLRPSLSLVADYLYRDLDYVDDKLDSKANEFGFGVRYEPDDRLSVLVTAGVRKKKFTNTGEDVSEPGYTAELTWRPTERQVVTAGFEREIREATTPDLRFRVVDEWYLSWTSKLAPRLVVNVEGRYADEERDSELLRDRDKHYGLLLEARYSFTYWLTGELGYEFNERNSNQDFFDYEQNIARASLKALF